MKYSFVFVAAAGLAAAQSGAQQAATIAGTITNIQNSVGGLSSQISSYQTQANSDSLQSASGAVLSTIATSANTVQPLPGNIAIDAALGFADGVNSLGAAVKSAIDSAVAKKTTFSNTCVGPLVLRALTDQAAAAQSYGSLVRSKLDQSNAALLSVADNLINGINAPLASGVSAFADQTALPASCSQGGSQPTAAPPAGSSAAPAPTSAAASSGAASSVRASSAQAGASSAGSVRPPMSTPTYAVHPNGTVVTSTRTGVAPTSPPVFTGAASLNGVAMPILAVAAGVAALL